MTAEGRREQAPGRPTVGCAVVAERTRPASIAGVRRNSTGPGLAAVALVRGPTTLDAMSTGPVDRSMHRSASLGRALAPLAAVQAGAGVSASGAVAAIPSASLKGAGPVT